MNQLGTMVEQVDVLDDDLRYTQVIRKQLVTAITSNATMEEIVADEDSSSFLLAVLKDMDTQSLSLKKMKKDDEHLDKIINQKAIVSDILSTLAPQDARYRDSSNSNKRSLDESDGTREYVKDELMVGDLNLDIDNFNNQNP